MLDSDPSAASLIIDKELQISNKIINITSSNNTSNTSTAIDITNITKEEIED